MRSRGPRVSLRPAPVQDPLLRLVFASDGNVGRRWRDLQPFDLDALEIGSLCALPLLHRRLVDGGVDDPLLPRLLGTSRKAWYRTQLQLEHLLPAVSALRHADVEPLLVGAAARAALYVPHPGERVVPFLELLVSPSDAPAARSAMHEAGWHAAGGDGSEDGPAVGRFTADQGTVVLHQGAPWQLVEDRERESAFELFVAASCPYTVAGAAVATLDPADELLAVCGVDARHGDPASLQPLIDAHEILTSSRPVDLARLCANARRFGLVLPVRDVLARLRDLSETARVDDALAALDAEAVSRRDTVTHRLTVIRAGALGDVPQTLASLLHARRSEPSWRVLRRIPRSAVRRVRRRFRVPTQSFARPASSARKRSALS